MMGSNWNSIEDEDCYCTSAHSSTLLKLHCDFACYLNKELQEEVH